MSNPRPKPGALLPPLRQLCQRTLLDMSEYLALTGAAPQGLNLPPLLTLAAHEAVGLLRRR